MPWPVNITTLTPSLVSAWLVFMLDWETWKASLVVALAAAGIVIALFAAIMVLSDSENRIELWQVVRQTLRDDLDHLLTYFRIRRWK